MKLKQVLNNIKTSIKSRIAKTLGIKTVGDYKAELEKFLEDIELLSQSDTVDELIAELGIAGTAREYQNLNNVFKDYYRVMIKELDQSENVSPQVKQMARKCETEWKNTLKGVVNYLYKKKNTMMYGEALEDDPFTPKVKIYKSNAWSDQPLPWLRKENIHEGCPFDEKELGPNPFDEDQIEEGLFGALGGGISGTVLGLVGASLGRTFGIHPKLFVGFTAALGTIIGQFIQKHYFLDLTNYVKLKRYIEYEPEAYPVLLELMQLNATKFKEKNPTKYKKIIENLKRLQKNPPPEYRSYLGDEIDNEYDDDSSMFDVTDKQGNLVKRGTSEIQFGSGVGYSSSSSQRRRPSSSRRASRNYDTKDLGDTREVEQQLDDLLNSI